MNVYGLKHDIEQASGLIKKICQLMIIPAEVEQFALICIRLALASLELQEQKGFRIRETNNPRELQAIAADCIADLFARNIKGNYIYLTRYFQAHFSDDPTDLSLFIALRRLVTRKVQQHLSRIYQNRDPEGARLLRNIRLATRRHPGFVLIRDITGEKIQYHLPNDRNSEIGIYRPLAIEVETTGKRIFCGKCSTDQLVLRLFAEFALKHRQVIEIRIKEIAFQIRRWQSALDQPEPSISAPIIEQQLAEEALQFKIDKILDRLADKILTKYVNKGKVTLTQGLALHSALIDISKDALQAGNLDENYLYLKKHWPQLSRERYMNSERKIFEYFIRQFKDAIRREFLNDG